jgi:hypothetical protein
MKPYTIYFFDSPVETEFTTAVTASEMMGEIENPAYCNRVFTVMYLSRSSLVLTLAMYARATPKVPDPKPTKRRDTTITQGEIECGRNPAVAKVVLKTMQIVVASINEYLDEPYEYAVAKIKESVHL